MSTKRILGLDLGTTSIGWAYILESDQDEDNQILQTGVRIVPIDTNSAKKFNEGQSVSPNKGRTLARTARKGKMRYRLRREALTKMLVDMGIAAQKTPQNIWQIRANAASEKVSLQEFSQILYHFNQKRGYKGGKNDENNDKEIDSNYLKGIDELEAKIAVSNLTPAQYHLQEQAEIASQNEKNHQNGQLKGPDYRFKNGAGESKILRRETYKTEFETIWEQQAAAYPTILTKERKEKIRDKIIFYQRRLKSQKTSIGKCTYEKGYRTIPKSHPLYQDFVIWQTINNLVIKDKSTYKAYLPTDKQRQTLFEGLSESKGMKKTEILKQLGYNPKAFELNYDEIKGNTTREKFIKAFEKVNLDTAPLKTPPPSIVAENDMVTTLWHLLYATEPTKTLNKDQVIKNVLVKRYNMTEAQATIISKINFSNDFGNLSARAIRKLMKPLQDGSNYHEAKQAVGYNDLEKNPTTAENEERILLDKLDLLKTNQLRNPIVERLLQHLINVVNDIIADPILGRPDEIRIELARELKSTATQRDSMQKSMNNNKKENDNAVAAIEKEGVRPTKKMIERYKLFKQTDGIDLYSGETMKLADGLNEQIYQIDHIIPQAKYFDDSLNNKILTRAALNLEKANRTAFDYMSSRSGQQLEAYQERVKDLNKRLSGYKKTHQKIQYLLMTEADIPQDFISRQLKETQYIVVAAKEILKKVVRNVYSTSGGVTNWLRQQWGIDVLLEKMVAQEGVYPEEMKMDRTLNRVSGHYVGIKDWTKRLDHRHHALDALVVACTKHAIVNRLNQLSKFAENATEMQEKLTNGNSARKFKKPWRHFVRDAEKALGDTLISFKKQGRVATLKKNRYKYRKGESQKTQQIWTPRGAFHKETIYGKIKILSEPIAIEKLKEKEGLQNIAHQWQKDALQQRLDQFNGNWKKAFNKLEENPIWIDAEKTRKFEFIRRFEECYVVRKEILALKDVQVKDIVDPKIREAVEKAWADVKAKGKKLDAETLAKYTRARSVRWRDGAESLTAIHKSPIDGMPIDFVYTRNNHHAAIYKNEEGKLNEEIVTFWEAFERKRQGVPVIQDKHPDLGTLQTSIIIGEMFVFGMTKPELEEAIAEKNWKKISKHLFRCQKLTTKCYEFRHHLATKIDQDFQMVRIQSLPKMIGIKVEISKIGRIKMV